jgi:chemotaxis protein CheX
MGFNQNMLKAQNISEEDLTKFLISDIKEVFSTMVGMEDILPIPTQIEPMTRFEDCLTSMVGLAGSYSGLVSIHTPQKLAMQITSSMLGMDVTEMNEDVQDALGEVANMVAGSFKLHLARGGADIRISTPSVITGAEYAISAGTANDTMTLRFMTDEDWFIVAITLETE